MDKLVIGWIGLGLLACYLGVNVWLIVVSMHRKRKYGCSRCEYRKKVQALGGMRYMCTASCGNEKGMTCPAWRFRDVQGEDNG